MEGEAEGEEEGEAKSEVEGEAKLEVEGEAQGGTRAAHGLRERRNLSPRAEGLADH